MGPWLWTGSKLSAELDSPCRLVGGVEGLWTPARLSLSSRPSLRRVVPALASGKRDRPRNRREVRNFPLTPQQLRRMVFAAWIAGPAHECTVLSARRGLAVLLAAEGLPAPCHGRDLARRRGVPGRPTWGHL